MWREKYDERERVNSSLSFSFGDGGNPLAFRGSQVQEIMG
jgi:hypothetical protein